MIRKVLVSGASALALSCAADAVAGPGGAYTTPGGYTTSVLPARTSATP